MSNTSPEKEKKTCPYCPHRASEMWKYLQYHPAGPKTSPPSTPSTSKINADEEASLAKDEEPKTSESLPSTQVTAEAKNLNIPPPEYQPHSPTTSDTKPTAEDLPLAPEACPSSAAQKLTHLSIEECKADQRRRENRLTDSWYETKEGKDHLKICHSCGGSVLRAIEGMEERKREEHLKTVGQVGIEEGVESPRMYFWVRGEGGVEKPRVYGGCEGGKDIGCGSGVEKGENSGSEKKVDEESKFEEGKIEEPKGQKECDDPKYDEAHAFASDVLRVCPRD